MEVNLRDEHKVRIIDTNEKNKFKFEWMDRFVSIKLPANANDAGAEEEMSVKVGDSIKKIEVSGTVNCQLCSDNIYYGKRGFAAISDHIKRNKHASKVRARRTNYILPATYFGVQKSAATCSSSEISSVPCTSSCTVQMPMNVPLSDRITNAQSLVLGVLAENNLPFTMSPVLIELSKVLATDKKALNHLNMSRTAASYKMRLGLAKTVIDQTTVNLQRSKFSLNIDEATAHNFKRVLSILVSYFSSIQNRVVVEHLASVSVFRVSSETLFKQIVKVFEDYAIPWDNLMSVLMDSCNVMRGSKSGLETRIREKAPHLLDIDGDSCHHIHNSAKKFCKPFKGHVEKYFTDVFNDFKWSADQKECLREICLILGIKFTAIENMISFRWLSCYDVSLSHLRIIDALSVIYYAFVSHNDKTIYFSILAAIYLEKGVASEGRARIKEIHQYLADKKMTPEGICRKERIVQKLFKERKKTELILHFYTAVLPLLKKYVCLFQTKEPLIHKLYDEQEQLFLNFLSCFVKAEILKEKNVKQLLSLNVSEEENLLQGTKMFLGSAESIVSKNLEHDAVAPFLKQAKQAYVECAHYLQNKLPLDNCLLKCISAIDPVARGHSATANRLKTLPKLVTNILTAEEVVQYSLDVHLYQVDKFLPSYVDEHGNILRVDIWWAAVFVSNKYSALTKMVLALLSCFHSPQVESSFSMMGDVIDKESGNMNIETFSAIQTVKYKLFSENKSAIDFFKKNDFLHDPVDKKLCHNMKTSYQEYQKQLEDKKQEMEKKKQLSATKNLCSKIKTNNLIKNRENNLRLAHKRRLEKLVEKKTTKKKKIALALKII